jgi:hypothetical protein
MSLGETEAFVEEKIRESPSLAGSSDPPVWFQQFMRSTTEREERMEQRISQLQHQVQQQALSQPRQSPTSTALPLAAALGLATPPATSSRLGVGTGLYSAAALGVGASRRTLNLERIPLAPSATEPAASSFPPDVPSPSLAAILERHEERHEAALDKAKTELIKKMHPPVEFTGEDVKQREAVREWVEKVNDYMDLFLPAGGEQELRFQIVKSRTAGPASTWLKELKTQALAIGRTLLWNEVEPLFIAKMEGSQSHLLLELEFRSLTLGKGKCRDLHALEAEFDRLRLRLYPLSEANVGMDSLLGQEYGHAIERGDSFLYTDILKMGVPISLAEWKLGAQQAFVIRQATSRSSFQSARTAGWIPRGAAQSPQESSRSKWAPAGSGVTVNHVEAHHQQEVGNDRKHLDDEKEPAALQSVNAQPASRRGWRLTAEERDKLMKQGKCFICYKKAGHLARECTNKPPGRGPSPDDLKA